MIFFKKSIAFILAFILLVSACACSSESCSAHVDGNIDGMCDACGQKAFAYIDIYSIGDIPAEQPIVKLENYIRQVGNGANTLVLSVGNMWLEGEKRIPWMDSLGFDAMTPGSCELSKGIPALKDDAKNVSFPLLAINVYDRSTNTYADFCKPSVTLERDGATIGIIGAVTADVSEDIYIRTGDDLTALVKAESERLRKEEHADIIIYLLHDGYSRSDPAFLQKVSDGQIKSYYDISLSDGYVDIVFEGKTGKAYRLEDRYGIYHLQNPGGISYASITISIGEGKAKVGNTKLISSDAELPIPEAPEDESSSDSEDSYDTSNDSEDSYDTSNDSEESGDTSEGGGSNDGCDKHADENGDTVCDICDQSVIVYFDFYTINDLHGKLVDSDSHPGVDELTTFLKNAGRFGIQYDQRADHHRLDERAGFHRNDAGESRIRLGLRIHRQQRIACGIPFPRHQRL